MPASRPTPPSAASVHTWLFDLDNTLYPAATRLFDQISVRMTAYIVQTLGLEPVAARVRQKQLFMRYGTTLRGLMTEHAIDPAPFLDFVHDIDFSVIAPATALDAALGRLPGRKLVFTNGTTPYALRVLHALGIERHFDDVFDIVSADHIPKPDMRPYHQICALHAVQPVGTVMVEDIPANLAPAHALGMGTVWVRPEPDHPLPDGADNFIHHQTDDLAAWLAGLR